MKEKDIKKIIVKSELKTNADFTNNLMAQIKGVQPQRYPIKLWTLKHLTIGFIVLTATSGFLLYTISNKFSFTGSAFVPLIWSLVLLLGFSYLLSMNKVLRYTGIVIK